MKRFAALCLMLWLPILSCPAQEDQYMVIYDLIQEGDTLLDANQPVQALAKYIEAQNRLQRFRQVYPNWNPKIINYRVTYLAEKTASLSEHLPTVKDAKAGQTNGTPVPALSASEMASRIQMLQAQVQQMQAEKESLEAKLKEALSARPASVDPRELAKAQEQVKALQKENELLKVNLEEKSRSVATLVGGPTMSELKEQLDAANKRLAEQAGQLESLTAEKSKLQERLLAATKTQADTNDIARLKSALEEANRKLSEQTQITAKLAIEKQTLQERLESVSSPNDAVDALRAENMLLRKQLADLKSQATDLKSQPAAQPDTASAASNDALNALRAENALLRKQLSDLRSQPAESDTARELAEARAQIAALLAEKEALRLERVVLESRVKQASAAPAAVEVSAPAPVAAGAESARIKELEEERNALRAQLAVAREELNTRYAGQALAGRVQELTAQLEVLRTRLSVLEAQKVPYTEEELALLKAPAVRPAVRQPEAEPASIQPVTTATLIAEAQKDFAARRFEDAERKYQQVLTRDEKNVFTLANLAAIQMEMNRLEDAEKNVMQALAIEPDDPYSVAILGFLQFRQGKYDVSLDTLAKAAKLDPRNAQVQNYIGLALSHKGMSDAAEAALRKALEIDPKYASAHYNLAVVYVTQKPPSVALARLHYSRALALGMQQNEEFERLLNQAETARAGN